MTVFDNLAFPLKVREGEPQGRSGTRVREVLELVELGPYEKRYPHQLSGGQQQRVALGARARLLAVGAAARRAVLEPRREAARARPRVGQGAAAELGLTTIFVTHDQDEALR